MGIGFLPTVLLGWPTLIFCVLLASCAQGPLTLTTPHPIQAENDGWATLHGPVTGGNQHNTQTYLATTRAELVGALNRAKDRPKIIYIQGRINLSVNTQNQEVGEEYYRDPEFNWPAYEQNHEGPQEAARKRSQERQAATVIVPVGSNISLIGISKDAALVNGGLMIKDAQNVVIYNIAFEDAYDYFPTWDPKDNAHGEWNALYDNITIHNSKRIWIHHCTFSDGARPDKINRMALGRPMQFHDGLVDIIRESDLITLSYNHFKNHDKVMLIGNGDRRTEDAGKLRVTLHHNWFENIKERAPRVRYGQVHVVNNLYTANPGADYTYGYSIGVGVGSQLIVENNLFLLNNPKARVFKYWRGEHLQTRNNLLDGVVIDVPTMLLKESANAMMKQVNWQAKLIPTSTPMSELSQHIQTRAGSGKSSY